MFISLIQHTWGRRERVRVSVKKVLGHLSQCGPATHLYAKLETLIVICRVTWAKSERVNMYSRQLIILLRKIKAYAT